MKTIVYVDAVEMTADAFEDNADAFILISGDSDHSAALSLARHRRNKKTIVFNPHPGNCNELRQLSSFYKNIPADLPARCQLPDEIPVGTHDRIIRRPAAWK